MGNRSGLGRRPAIDALVAFAAATGSVVALFQLGRVSPLVGEHLQTLVAVVFLYVPAAIAWRRGQDLRELGFTVRPFCRGAAFGLGALLAIFPLFLVGFLLFYHFVYAHSDLRALRLPGLSFVGWSGLSDLRLGPDFSLELVVAQVVAVALPEELFFRGFLLARLEQAFPPRRRVLGGGVGTALFASALLFATSHVVLDFDPRRLAVFFPALLFGWLRSATGSIFAGVVVHASCNLYIAVLSHTFFR